MPKLDDRALFVAVADGGSFSEAAASLGVPLSTLSRRIARLEAELGVVLLERTTRHVRLTELGREYAERLRPLLLMLGDVDATLATRNSRASGSLRIAAPAGLGRPFFGPAIVTLHNTHPDLEIVWSAAVGVHPIRDGFDLVIAEQRLVDEQLIARKLLTTREVCVASPAYLARRGIPASVDDLTEHDTLVLGAGRERIAWPLPRGGAVAVRPVLRCDDYSLLLEAAVHGLGVALVPLLILPSFLQEKQLEIVLDGAVGARRDIYLIYARSSRRRGVVRALVDFAFEYARDTAKTVPVLAEL
ncbi:MAG TPA: LysR family transcriptional regulator [Nannocystaceae bacterium]|nr:LysR family transcriptional regulator [Nannocystaceae bacterium]